MLLRGQVRWLGVDFGNAKMQIDGYLDRSSFTASIAEREVSLKAWLRKTKLELEKREAMQRSVCVCVCVYILSLEEINF